MKQTSYIHKLSECCLVWSKNALTSLILLAEVDGASPQLEVEVSESGANRRQQ